MSRWINNSRSADPRQIDSAFLVDRRTINYVKQIQRWSGGGMNNGVSRFRATQDGNKKILITAQLVSIRFQSPVSRPASTGTHENNWIGIPRWISKDFFQLEVGPKDNNSGRNKNWFPFEAIWSRRPDLRLTKLLNWRSSRSPKIRKKAARSRPRAFARHPSRLTRPSQSKNKQTRYSTRDRDNKRQTSAVDMWVLRETASDSFILRSRRKFLLIDTF